MDTAEWGESVRQNVRKAIFGKDDVVTTFLVALVCDGHLLLEDVPGVGKTILARAVAASLECDMKRLQCTPDLMPADVTGVSVYDQRSGEFTFRKGPVSTNILLVDEINRAAPRTQSALLEAMEERSITVDGKRSPLPEPFVVVATENPLEFDGTFPLPAVQKDRFFLAATMGYPDVDAEREILQSQRRISHPVEDLSPVTNLEELQEVRAAVRRVEVGPEVRSYILDLLEETRRDPRLVLAASPRAGRALYRGSQAIAALGGRDRSTVADVHALAPAVLWKRLVASPESILKGTSERQIIAEILQRLPVPEGRGGRR